MTLDTTIGGASSDSYGTLAEYQAYAAIMGWTLSGDDTTDEVNLRRSAMSEDRQYSFIGYRQYQTQAREWPRIYAGYVEGWPIDPDTIPQDIKYAQFELAYLIQGGFDPFATISGSEKGDMIKVGPITISDGSTSATRDRVVAIEGLLGPYLKAGRGQMKLVRG